MSPLQFATRDFLQSGILTMIDTGESVKPPFKKRNSKCCSSEAYQASNVQAISKGSDHSVRMRRLICAYAYAHATLLEISCCGSYMDLLDAFL